MAFLLAIIAAALVAWRQRRKEQRRLSLAANADPSTVEEAPLEEQKALSVSSAENSANHTRDQPTIVVTRSRQGYAVEWPLATALRSSTLADFLEHHTSGRDAFDAALLSTHTLRALARFCDDDETWPDGGASEEEAEERGRVAAPDDLATAAATSLALARTVSEQHVDGRRAHVTKLAALMHGAHYLAFEAAFAAAARQLWSHCHSAGLAPETLRELLGADDEPLGAEGEGGEGSERGLLANDDAVDEALLHADACLLDALEELSGAWRDRVARCRTAQASVTPSPAEGRGAGLRTEAETTSQHAECSARSGQRLAPPAAKSAGAPLVGGIECVCTEIVD
jgi:hypothetical protein